MLYSINDYRKEFFPGKSTRTVLRMIKSDSLYTGHKPIFISGIFLIDVSVCENYEPYILAIRDYLKAKKIPVDLELSTKFGIKYNVESIRHLNEILGYNYTKQQ